MTYSELPSLVAHCSYRLLKKKKINFYSIDVGKNNKERQEERERNNI